MPSLLIIRMWAVISAIQVFLPGVLLISLVWYGATLARDGRIDVGQLVTVYSAATLMLFPLRNVEEIAMAYSFSRPSAQRAVRVLSLRRTTRPPSADAEVPHGDHSDYLVMGHLHAHHEGHCDDHGALQAA